MLYYLPLEAYKERYTILMSAKDGWIEDLMKRNKVDFTRVEGMSLNNTKSISSGIVLDFFNRSFYSLTQISEVIKMLSMGIIKNGDTIYLDDFWTPGVEAIAYSAQLAGIQLNIYAMLHAQTVDKYDFTYKLKEWMRHYEIGQSTYMKGIFVTSEYLLDLCTEAGLKNVYFGGLPYNSEFIKKHFPITQSKIPQVIFCSRFDAEKRPDFFINIARALYGKYKFVMTSSFSKLSSNSPPMLKIINDAANEGIIELKLGLTKTEYYEELQKSMYQVNCALQDWLSWTMLEALTYQCTPVYPQYRSFPEYLSGSYLYKPDSVENAVHVIENNKVFNNELLSIVGTFDKSFERMLKVMKDTSV